MNLRQVCLIFLCSHFLLYASSARAQAPLFTSFTTRDGLAADYITSIAFEKSGAAWIGTPKGATRIEGNYWVTYTTAHGLGNDFVNGIAVGANNRVYFATFGGGLTVFDGASRKTYTTANSQIPSNYLIAVAVDKQNRVWVATFGAGFARLDGEQWARFNLPDNYINALTLDANGHAWIATNGGAYYFEGQSATPVTQNSGLASNRVLSIAVAPNGSVWFGTDNGVTVRETAARFRTFREADGLANNFAKAIAVDAQNRVWIGTPRGLTQFDGKAWKTFLPADGLSDNVIAILAIDPNNNAWIGTPRGLSVAGISLERTTTLPVVLVHGWRTADSDLVDDGEFRFLVQYLERDGVQVFYAAGISPTQTLLQNAARLRDVIAAAKAKTGAPKVDLIAFSMGGLNARAFLESTLYENDVRRAIILGTPQAGVRLWLPFLAREIEDRPAEPSGVELTEEYAALFNQTHAPRATVPYDLLVGDARGQGNFELLKILPPGDGLIEQASAHALAGPQVRRMLNSDLHAWEPSQLPINLTSYLYPDQTYTRYIRNALRDPDARPIGPAAAPVEPIAQRNITPMIVTMLEPSETITRTVLIDPNRAARFFARWSDGDVTVQLRAPDGTRYNGENLRDTNYLKADLGPFIGYNFPRAQTGVWSVIATRKDRGAKPITLTAYADLDADLTLNAATDRAVYPLGASVVVSATLSNRASNADARAKILWLGDGVNPRTVSTEVKLLGEGEPGTYSNTITNLTRAGYYLLHVTAASPTFGRERVLLFALSPDSAKFAGAPRATLQGAPGNYAGILVESEVTVARAGAFAFAATARNAKGEIVAALTAPLTLAAGAQTVALTIPGRELRARGVDGPYTFDLTLMDAAWTAILIDEKLKAITTEAVKASEFGE